jgi:aminomethyltransferase
MIALGSVGSSTAEAGTGLDMELTVDHQRKHVRVAVTKLPFFDPPRKRA